jgi:hypothetical protein
MQVHHSRTHKLDNIQVYTHTNINAVSSRDMAGRDNKGERVTDTAPHHRVRQYTHMQPHHVHTTHTCTPQSHHTAPHIRIHTYIHTLRHAPAQVDGSLSLMGRPSSWSASFSFSSFCAYASACACPWPSSVYASSLCLSSTTTTTPSTPMTTMTTPRAAASFPFGPTSHRLQTEKAEMRQVERVGQHKTRKTK